jgi:hypothetical protein
MSLPRGTVSAFGMSSILTYEQLLETRLNLLARDYGYRYRLDICAIHGFERVEFVRTLREARFVGIPVRRAGRLVRFFKIEEDGTLKCHNW